MGEIDDPGALDVVDVRGDGQARAHHDAAGARDVLVPGDTGAGRRHTGCVQAAAQLLVEGADDRPDLPWIEASRGAGHHSTVSVAGYRAQFLCNFIKYSPIFYDAVENKWELTCIDAKFLDGDTVALA